VIYSTRTENCECSLGPEKPGLLFAIPKSSCKSTFASGGNKGLRLLLKGIPKGGVFGT
jgi:hypothetical protein